MRDGDWRLTFRFSAGILYRKLVHQGKVAPQAARQFELPTRHQDSRARERVQLQRGVGNVLGGGPAAESGGVRGLNTRKLGLERGARTCKPLAKLGLAAALQLTHALVGVSVATLSRGQQAAIWRAGAFGHETLAGRG